MTTEPLVGRSLDRAIAEAMGWTHFHGDASLIDGKFDRGVLPGDDSGRTYRVPAFHESLDALRDGPEKVLREAGWWMCLYEGGEAPNTFWLIEWRHPRLATAPLEMTATTESVARANAALKALTALQEVNRGG